LRICECGGIHVGGATQELKAELDDARRDIKNLANDLKRAEKVCGLWQVVAEVWGSNDRKNKLSLSDLWCILSHVGMYCCVARQARDKAQKLAKDIKDEGEHLRSSHADGMRLVDEHIQVALVFTIGGRSHGNGFCCSWTSTFR
jgi:hypothetical protein